VFFVDCGQVFYFFGDHRDQVLVRVTDQHAWIMLQLFKDSPLIENQVILAIGGGLESIEVFKSNLNATRRESRSWSPRGAFKANFK
jgi:hypothetical protein